MSYVPLYLCTWSQIKLSLTQFELCTYVPLYLIQKVPSLADFGALPVCLCTGSTISLCDFWFGLKWHSNVLYIWKQDVFITTTTHHLIWNISWCQLTLFLSSKLIWSKQAILYYFCNYFYLKLSFFLKLEWQILV